MAHAALLIILVPATKITYDLIVPEYNNGFHPFNWAKLLRSVEISADTGALLYALVIGAGTRVSFTTGDIRTGLY